VIRTGIRTRALVLALAPTALLLSMNAAPALATVTAGPAVTGAIVFDGSAGTAAPPSTLGPYAMTQAAADPRPVDATVPDTALPDGTMDFSPSVIHMTTPNGGWATWSNNYTGDVYYDSGTTLTMTLPSGTGAFYFYAEPNAFATFTVQAVAQNGTTSGPVSVSGAGGATYLGRVGVFEVALVPSKGPHRAARSVAELAKNAGQVGAVRSAEPAEDPLGLGPARRADRVEDTGAALGQLGQRGPAVGRVRPAFGQATGLKSVDHLRDRTRGDTQVLRQFRQAHGAMAPEYAQCPEGGGRDVPGGQRLMRGLPQPPRHGPEGLRQGLVGTRIAPGRRRPARIHRVHSHRNIIAKIAVAASY